MNPPFLFGKMNASGALFYYFRLEDQVPENHLLLLILILLIDVTFSTPTGHYAQNPTSDSLRTFFYLSLEGRQSQPIASRGRAVNPKTNLYSVAVGGGCSFETLYFLSHAGFDGVVYTDGKMLPPPHPGPQNPPILTLAGTRPRALPLCCEVMQGKSIPISKQFSALSRDSRVPGWEVM